MHFGYIRDISAKHDHLVVGLDVGTTSVRVVVGEAVPEKRSGDRDSSSRLNIIGSGMVSSRGIKKGVITNIEIMAESIAEAVKEAENTAGVEIRAVHAGITGAHIGCLSSHGVIAVKEDIIGQKEVNNVIDAARAMALPFDREMLHVIPSGFTVNGQNGITDPRGMGGIRLETNVRIITGASTSIQNLIRSCGKAGVEVIDVVFQPLALAETVVNSDEKELGAAVIDIGGGTTDIALFHEGNICHTAVLGIGGNSFTNDIAVGLRIPAREAEELKKRHGCAMLSMVRDDEEIEAGHSGAKISRSIPRSYLVEIIQPRAEELFGLIKKEIVDRGFHKNMNSGAVLTGGAALMEGMDVMAENMLELPVRIGSPGLVEGPEDITGEPLYSTGIGLSLYGAGEEYTDHEFGKGSMFSGLSAKMSSWFRGAFR
jgi:cell division protein FtsA